MTPYELVLSKIDEPISLNDKTAKFCCPCHDDHNPSGSVTEADDGKVLLKCWGCNATAADMVKAWGLEMSDLFVTRPTSPIQPRREKSGEYHPKAFPDPHVAMLNYRSNLGEPVKTWDYHDATGKHVASMGRFNKPDGSKEFRPVSLGDDGKWYCEGPQARPLYNLPEVAKAETVYVTEGEKSADAAKSLGVVATTSMNGAKSPHKTDWSPLAGKLVVILPDNDAPGWKYVETVTEIVGKLNPPATVKVVALPVHNPGDDIVEWIANHGDAAEPEQMRAELEQLVATAPAPAAPGDDIEILWAEDLITKYPEMRETIIDGLVRRGETVNIIAAPKTGKSWLAVNLALTVASGRKWLGRYATKPGKVLIVDNELHPETTSKRLQQISQAMGIDFREHRKQVATINVRGKLTDLKKLAVQLANPKFAGFSVIILDAWYRFQPEGSDENSNADVTQLYNLLDSVAAKLDCAFVCIHHTSKGNQSAKGVTDIGSGAGAQSRAADTHLTIRQHAADSAVVVDAAVRSFPPVEPFCLRCAFPLWTEATDLDPRDLRQEKGRKKNDAPAIAPSPEQTRQQKEQAARLRVLEVYSAHPEGNTESKVAAEAGMNSRTFAPINGALLRDGMLIACNVKKHHASYDGLKLTPAGLDELRRLRQLRQNEELSDQSDIPPTTALSLESGVSRRCGVESEKSDWILSEFERDNAGDLFGGRPA